MRKHTIGILLAILLLTGCAAKPETAAIQIFAMDTIMSLAVQGEGSQKAVDEAVDLIYELEGLLSVTDETSEIWALNHAEGEWVSLSQPTYDLISLALQIGEETEGAVDATIYPALTAWGFTTGDYRVPDEETLAEILPLVDDSAVELDDSTRSIRIPQGMELDLGAVAKGYTAQKVAEIFSDMDSALLNLGGNTYAVGTKSTGEDWRIGIQNPNGDGYLGVVSIPGGKGVITSGGYQRFFEEDGVTYWHILDPKTGSPAQTDLRSVSIVGGDGTRCDGLSTALFVMGRDKAMDFWRSHQDFDMILVDEDDIVTITPNLMDSFTLGDDNSALVEVVVP